MLCADVCHTFYGTFLHEAIANEYSNLGALFEIIPEEAKAKLLVSKDGQGRTPWMLALRTRNISLIKEMINQKLLTVKASQNIIRLLPPLILEEKHVDEAILKINKAFKNL